MKKALIISLAIFVSALGLYKTAKIFIPSSIQVYFAGVAGCNFDQQALAERDPQFEKIKWWELSISTVFSPLLHLVLYLAPPGIPAQAWRCLRRRVSAGC